MNLIAIEIIIITIICACKFYNSESLDYEWNNFKKTYNKFYSDDKEEEHRRSIWTSNLDKIYKHNAEAQAGAHSFTLKMNKYGDLENKEFVNIMNRFNKTNRNVDKMSYGSNTFSLDDTEINNLPDSVDWREKGYVTPIKDQGMCGSCYAFSAVASLEGQHFKKNKTLISLSEQNLVDCSGSFGNFGCEGGLMDQSFRYIQSNKGIDTEDSYPYEAQDASCRFKTNNVGATDIGYNDIKSGDEFQLTNAIATIGPISVAIDASHFSFQFYNSGIYSEQNCSSVYLDHAITAVGYGTNEQGQDFYIVKNSWGTDWGESGYVLIARNKNNMCGIATAASYPLV